MEIENKEKSKHIPGISLGINIAFGMAFFTIIGNWIDQKQGDQHIWILVGMVLGLIYCGYEIWKLIRLNKDQQINNKQAK